MTLKHLLKWAPFKIDALGLLTLLGADEVNLVVGTLTFSQVCEFLPLMGGHVVASDSIRNPLTGFTLYNISDGICASDMAPWFCRWLQSQGLTYNATTLAIGSTSPSEDQKRVSSQPIVLGIILNAILISVPLSLGDWWGFANATALIIAALLRAAIVGALREAIDSSVSRASAQSQELVKALLRLPDGSSIVMYTYRGLITECLLCNPKSRNKKRYTAFKVGLWIVFSIHIISIGMAALPTQILTIIVVGGSTICLILGVGRENQTIGANIQIRRFDRAGNSQPMAAMFANLHLTKSEEECMISWRLMPCKTNLVWWTKYRTNLAKGTTSAFDDWKKRDTWVATEWLLPT